MKIKGSVFLFVVFLFTVFVFAEEAVLIDFSLLRTDTESSSGRSENRHTMTEIPTGQRTSIVSLAAENWDIEHSIRTVETVSRSSTRETPSNQWGTVFGARVFFPSEAARFNTWARITPPFTIPLDDPRFENGYGLLKDQRGMRLRTVSVNAYGLNFPVGLSLGLRFNDDPVQYIYMGELNHAGWRELVWVNPYLVLEERDGTGFYDSIRFDGFRIQNNAVYTGDFIFYIKDVTVVYDNEEEE